MILYILWVTTLETFLNCKEKHNDSMPANPTNTQTSETVDTQVLEYNLKY